MLFTVTDTETTREIEAESEYEAKRSFLAAQPKGRWYGRAVAGKLTATAR